MNQLHPVIQALFDYLPKEGTPWPAEKRVQWLIAIAAAFDLIYQRENDGEVLKIRLEWPE